jgi:hypothetical protein
VLIVWTTEPGDPGIWQSLREWHTYFAVQLGFAAFPFSVATASASP